MANTSRRCYIVDKITGKVVSEHESLSAAAAELGMDPSICRQVRNKSLLDSRRCTVRLVEDYDPHESFEHQRKGVPVFAVRGREVRAWCDRGEAASDLHLAKSSLYDALYRKTPTMSGWRVFRMPRMGALNKVLGLEERC